MPPVTLWYDADTLPARSGVYETLHDPTMLYRYFDGENWYCGDTTPEKAMYRFQTLGCTVPAVRWRGLTEPAAA